MRRRQFIAGFGSAAAWPVAVRAQQLATVLGFVAAGSHNAATAFLILALISGSLSWSGLTGNRAVRSL